MNIKKIAVAIIITVLISAGLYYTMPMISLNDEMALVLNDKFNLTMCLTFGALFGIVYLILAYRTKGLNPEEIAVKRCEYFYNSFTAEQKGIVDGMTDVDKTRFYDEYEKVLSTEKVVDLRNYLHDLKVDKIPGVMKVIRKVAVVALVGYVGFYAYETAQAAQPAIDSYNAYMSATYDDQTLYIEGLPPIVLKSNGKFNQVETNKLIDEAIRTQPAWLLSKAQTIVLYSEELWTSTGIAGFAEFDYFNDVNTISNKVEINYHTKNPKEALTHELWHLVDYGVTINELYKYSNSPEFINLYNAAPSSIGEYAATNTKEFFADGGEMYISNPEQLQELNIDVYNFFNNNFSQYFQ